jgi:putative membrane protein
MARPLTPQEHQALADRIRAAEAQTRGEIYCVVARASDGYIYPAAFMLAVGLAVASIPVAFWLDRSWLGVSHLNFALLQAAALALAFAVVWALPARLRILLVPRRLRYRRAHDNAVAQFFAHNVHTTELRTGVLIFVSLAERYAEVVADSGINAKVAQGEWNGIVHRVVAAAAADRLPEGLGDAIDKAGALLAAHFPGGTRNPNELDDHVVEI